MGRGAIVRDQSHEKGLGVREAPWECAGECVSVWLVCMSMHGSVCVSSQFGDQGQTFQWFFVTS